MLRLSVSQAGKLGITGPPKKSAWNGPHNPKAPRKPVDEVFLAACRAHGLPEPVEEYLWHPKRKWRFDYLFDGWLAVERVGGVWMQGHHSRGQSQIDDMERRNEATGLFGYVVLEFTPEQFSDGSAFEMIHRVLFSEQERS